MKGKLALGFVLTSLITFAGCTTAPRQELSILDAVATGSMSQPQSCTERNAATVCVQSTRLNREKDCSCVDRSQFKNAFN